MKLRIIRITNERKCILAPNVNLMLLKCWLIVINLLDLSYNTRDLKSNIYEKSNFNCII